MEKKLFGVIIDKKAKILQLNNVLNIGNLSESLAPLIDSKIHVVCGIWWSIESPKQLLKLIYLFYKNRLKYPKVEISILCNTPLELKLLKTFAIPAIYCNQNCFVDENIYKVDKNVAKVYDAIYNAVLSDYKRHVLAKNIERLALITYGFENTSLKDFLSKALNNPSWLNYKSATNPVFLTADEVVSAYNQSHVGLALSKIEGAMYASTEYLLCGLSVVTTKSKGGRDIFLNPGNSITAAENVIEVAKAVSTLKEKRLDGEQIRKNTLLEFSKHREAFIEHINYLLKKAGFDHDIKTSWSSWYTNKLRTELEPLFIAQEFSNDPSQI